MYDVIDVGMSFYGQGREVNCWTTMPQVPTVGDSLHWSATGDPGDSRSWYVFKVSWVCDDQARGLWHAEIALR